MNVSESGVAKRPRVSDQKGTKATTEYHTNVEFLHLLVRLKAQQLPLPDGKLFVAQRTDKVVDVWKGLVQRNFLSVPVLQKTGSKYYGFIDLADIVKYFVDHFGEQRLKDVGENFWELVDKEKEFQEKTVNDLMTYPLSKRNPFHPVPRGYSLFAAVELLARERGLHRVPIVDEDRKLVHLATQSQVVDFLSRNLESMGTIRNKPASFICHTHSVITIHENDTAINAFKLMIEKNIHAVAVVNDEGQLSGVISVRDLKAISSDARLFWRLYQTVQNFIQKLKNAHDDRPHRVISAKPDESYESIIKKLAEHKLHGLFVVNEEHKPVGAVALKDILLELITH